MIGSEPAVMRDLGVHMDAELIIKQHIATVAASCFYHLRRLHQIRRLAGMEVTTQLVMAFITSRLLQLNARGPPTGNTAMRLILDLNVWDHVTPGMRQLATVASSMACPV